MCFRRQLARGDEALLEQPLRSAARRERAIVKLILEPGTIEVKSRMCPYGLQHPVSPQAPSRRAKAVVFSCSFLGTSSLVYVGSPGSPAGELEGVEGPEQASEIGQVAV